jgi:hypothetical protein
LANGADADAISEFLARTAAKRSSNDAVFNEIAPENRCEAAPPRRATNDTVSILSKVSLTHR